MYKLDSLTFMCYYLFLYFSPEEQEATSSCQPLTEFDQTKSEPLTVIEQPEVTASQPAANQAMKGIVVLKLINHNQIFSFNQFLSILTLLYFLLLFDSLIQLKPK